MLLFSPAWSGIFDGWLMNEVSLPADQSLAGSARSHTPVCRQAGVVHDANRTEVGWFVGQ